MRRQAAQTSFTLTTMIVLFLLFMLWRQFQSPPLSICVAYQLECVELIDRIEWSLINRIDLESLQLRVMEG